MHSNWTGLVVYRNRRSFASNTLLQAILEELEVRYQESLWGPTQNLHQIPVTHIGDIVLLHLNIDFCRVCSKTFSGGLKWI